MDTVSSGYITAWCIYLIAALGLIIVFWRMTRGLKKRRTRRVLRAFVGAVLLTPVNVSAEGLWLAPAYLVAAYDYIQGQTETALLALSLMLISFSAFIAVMLLESIGRRVFGMSTQY